jgi:hypothetical protein
MTLFPGASADAPLPDSTVIEIRFPLRWPCSAGDGNASRRHRLPKLYAITI